MSLEMIAVNCPTCHKAVIWQEKSIYRPFCSKRCQLIDLGEWVNEERRITGTEQLREEHNEADYAKESEID